MTPSARDGLSDQVDKDRFHVLCQLTDEQTYVANAVREYVTSDGRIEGTLLTDAARVISSLLDSIDGDNQREECE